MLRKGTPTSGSTRSATFQTDILRNAATGLKRHLVALPIPKWFPPGLQVVTFITADGVVQLPGRVLRPKVRWTQCKPHATHAHAASTTSAQVCVCV